MRILSSKEFEASREFIETTGRPLERARFHCAFQGADKGVVLHALGAFRNADGGFGHALEPDLRTPESSVLCTSIAFQILRALDVAPQHDLVSRGISYLLANFEQGQCGWRIIPETAENLPRAPWWYQKGREDHFSSFSLNPTAEILGYLFDYREQVPPDLIEAVSDRVFREINELDELDMHELLCCLRLFLTDNLPLEYRDQMHGKLAKLVDGTVARDMELWKGYSLRPLQVVEGPGSPFMAGLEDAVATNLDYEVATANSDGSWTPTWSWDDAFPEAWSKAKREWSGVVTLENLLTLKRFGRIDGLA
jgi:hypothetical protein